MSDLKNRIKFTSTADKELWEQFSKLSDLTRIDKSKLIDEAIEYLLEKYDINRLNAVAETRQKYKVDKRHQD